MNMSGWDLNCDEWDSRYQMWSPHMQMSAVGFEHTVSSMWRSSKIISRYNLCMGNTHRGARTHDHKVKGLALC